MVGFGSDFGGLWRESRGFQDGGFRLGRTFGGILIATFLPAWLQYPVAGRV